MRLHAIREYTCQGVCTCTGVIKRTDRFVVTFANDLGIVVAESRFQTSEEADFVVDAVNAAFDAAGVPMNHCSTWDM